MFHLESKCAINFLIIFSPKGLNMNISITPRFLSPSTSKVITQNKKNDCEQKQYFEFSKKSLFGAKNYSFAKKISFGTSIPKGNGIINATVTPIQDIHSFVVKFQAPKGAPAKATVTCHNTPNSPVKVLANAVGGVFTIMLNGLNRQQNILYPETVITNVTYFDKKENIVTIENDCNGLVSMSSKNFEKSKQSKEMRFNDTSVDGGFVTLIEGQKAGLLKKMTYQEMINYKSDKPVIAYIDEMREQDELLRASLNQNFLLPQFIEGVVLPTEMGAFNFFVDALGHVSARLRSEHKFFVLPDKTAQKSIFDKLDVLNGQLVKMNVLPDKMEIKKIEQLPAITKKKIEIPETIAVEKVLTAQDDEISPETSGLKAYNLKLLKKISSQGGFKVPEFVVVPSGLWDKIESANNFYTNENSDFSKNVRLAHKQDFNSDLLFEIKTKIINETLIPTEIQDEIISQTEKSIKPFNFSKNECLIVRSSFTGEDSEMIATQGLYDSFAGARTKEELMESIKKVCASKWSNIAYQSRKNNEIPHQKIKPNVVIQQVVPVDYTFTINTADPRTNDKNTIVIQLSQGVDSTFSGCPYIFEYNKSTGEIKRSSLATKGRKKDVENVSLRDTINGNYKTTDYSHDPLNLGKKDYEPILRKIANIALFIEQQMGNKPQDIEGGIIFNEKSENQVNGNEPDAPIDVHIWQTRNVQLRK